MSHDSPATSDSNLYRCALEAAQRAYAPYSSFPVGAALLTDTGEVSLGCNVENASYGLTICAERGAIAALIGRDATRHSDDGSAQRPTITKVAIAGLKAAPCFPCGACRQVLHEFGCKEVIVDTGDGKITSIPFAEILPHAFGPDDL